eukprot:TRINITY_DN28569_c0_g1_i1.p1 TRINITY_DN28569_c0_g1~~TRINITY_DN28569_c0_g1_i1.p1  ORF type:complete len:288 (+),score=16.47 TRINITY_DN28569_c0_g1_i1:104-967(+)
MAYAAVQSLNLVSVTSGFAQPLAACKSRVSATPLVGPLAILPTSTLSARHGARLNVRAAASDGQSSASTTAPAVAGGDDGEVPTPVVHIDQHTEADATVVELQFGDRLGALLDTMAALRSLGLNVVKGKVSTVDSLGQNRFVITQDGKKVEDVEMLEAIRGTIISNLLRYHPESSSQLAMGQTCDTPPCLADVPTHVSIRPGSDSKSSELYVETADRPGLLLSIVEVLQGLSITVTSAEIDTEGVVAKDYFTVSYHGEALDDEMALLTKNALGYSLSRPSIEGEESY